MINSTNRLVLMQYLYLHDQEVSCVPMILSQFPSELWLWKMKYTRFMVPVLSHLSITTFGHFRSFRLSMLHNLKAERK